MQVLDHIAFRVTDRKLAAKFYIDAFGYQIQDEFDIYFDDGTTAKCIALEPAQKYISNFMEEYSKTPEIFISDGDEESVVGKWVKEHGSGVHHIAYQVNSVKETMEEWKKRGFAEFTTDDVLTCPGLTQVFTKPSPNTGIIYEFIERTGEQGFCRENVKKLMNSTNEMED